MAANTCDSPWQSARMIAAAEASMLHPGTTTLDDRLDRIEEKLDQLSDLVLRMSDELESGLATARKNNEQEFRQLKQAITFWGGRTRALDDRDGPLRRRV
jgi:hypothetical protein